MTYTIELDASEERVLEAAARRRGVALDAYLREVLKREAQDNQAAETVRREAVRRGRGMFEGNGHETEDFMRERREEGLREMAAMDAAEDAEDLEDAPRIVAQSDPTKRRTLDELHAAIKLSAQKPEVKA